MGPVHVEHRGEHATQAVPLLKEPSGQRVPLDVVVEDVLGTQVDGEVGDCVNPDWQVMHEPEEAAQVVQPSAQTNKKVGIKTVYIKKVEGDKPLHVPSSAWKNPSAHAAHNVPFPAVVCPALHVHPPFPSQTPLRQLQDDGAFVTLSARQIPEPLIPSAH